MIKFIRNLFKRRKFVFTHENGAKRIIYAKNMIQAWKKMKVFIIQQMYGGWAMSYDDVAVNKQIGLLSINEIRELNNDNEDGDKVVS